MSGTTTDALARWEHAGRRLAVGDHEVFVVDVPAPGDDSAEPLLVIHGFPTSSFDFAQVVAQLSENRRVVLVDLVGFGLSSKPDIAYTMALQADAVEAVAATLGIRRLALLTHDMGDTVGGELLARHMSGEWPVEVTRRVVTNGSIYIEMAHLTAGQELLLSLPDAAIDEVQAPPRDAIAASLVATLAPGRSDVDMGPHAELVVAGGGNRLLPRTIRYIEERRRSERRFTGAIESHPSPLGVVWGAEDPIAVVAMTDRVRAARPDAVVEVLDGVGHYPQIEAPDRFAAAVLAALG